MNILNQVMDYLPIEARETARVWLFGLTKVPMLFWLRPKVVELSDQRCVVMLPLNRKTKNHLNSMYFGALAAGADCAGGLMAMMLIHQSGKKIALSFKDFKADFLKRAEGDTYFTCHQGEEIRQFVDRVIVSGERENLPVKITATCPKKLGNEPVVEFELTLSLKRK